MRSREFPSVALTHSRDNPALTTPAASRARLPVSDRSRNVSLPSALRNMTSSAGKAGSATVWYAMYALPRYGEGHGNPIDFTDVRAMAWAARQAARRRLGTRLTHDP
jgi:hypothetical protein